MHVNLLMHEHSNIIVLSKRRQPSFYLHVVKSHCIKTPYSLTHSLVALQWLGLALNTAFHLNWAAQLHSGAVSTFVFRWLPLLTSTRDEQHSTLSVCWHPNRKHRPLNCYYIMAIHVTGTSTSEPPNSKAKLRSYGSLGILLCWMRSHWEE